MFKKLEFKIYLRSALGRKIKNCKIKDSLSILNIY